MASGITVIETADMPEFGVMPNDFVISEVVLERLKAGKILRVPTNGCGVAYLKLREGSH